MEFKKGFADPTAKFSTYKSKLKVFNKKMSADSITFDQSAVWENWNQAKTNIGPVNLGDAPVMLTIGPHNYWMFGRYNKARHQRNFQPKPATLKGFDMPLQTTPFAHQYNAPGGLKKSLGGYHAWQSHDMVNWVHHGPVTESFSKWVTTAEYVDGKLYRLFRVLSGFEVGLLLILIVS